MVGPGELGPGSGTSFTVIVGVPVLPGVVGVAVLPGVVGVVVLPGERISLLAYRSESRSSSVSWTNCSVS